MHSPDSVRGFGHRTNALAAQEEERAAVTVVLTPRQYSVLHAETFLAMQRAERDEDVAMWAALHAGLSASRWRLPAALVDTAITYCHGIVDVTDDSVVRRSFSAVRRKLTARAAPPRPPLPLKVVVSAAATPGDENR